MGKMIKFHIIALVFALCQLKGAVFGGVMQQSQYRHQLTRRDVVDTIDAARAQLEQEARIETEKLLNALFQSQIDYFSKVKDALPPQTQRVRDIDAYISRLNQAIAVRDIAEKEGMWLDIFTEFNKSPLLLNNRDETHLTDTEFRRVLSSTRLEDVVKNFLADVAAYFWKMAKASGKVMQMTVQDLVKNTTQPGDLFHL